MEIDWRRDTFSTRFGKSVRVRATDPGFNFPYRRSNVVVHTLSNYPPYTASRRAYGTDSISPATYPSRGLVNETLTNDSELAKVTKRHLSSLIIKP
jgi:hypothetical protein